MSKFRNIHYIPVTMRMLHSLRICRKGYECIKILIAILLIRLKGLKMYKAGVALNLNRVFPLFNTTKVCGERKREVIKAWDHHTQQHFSRQEINKLECTCNFDFLVWFLRQETLRHRSFLSLPALPCPAPDYIHNIPWVRS